MSVLHVPNARFNPGQVVATSGALALTNRAYLTECLKMHVAGDWGLVCPEDAQANEDALKHGARLLSVYALPDDPGNFWIITEADRSVTTCLLPDEY